MWGWDAARAAAALHAVSMHGWGMKYLGLFACRLQRSHLQHRCWAAPTLARSQHCQRPPPLCPPDYMLRCLHPLHPCPAACPQRVPCCQLLPLPAAPLQYPPGHLQRCAALQRSAVQPRPRRERHWQRLPPAAWAATPGPLAGQCCWPGCRCAAPARPRWAPALAAAAALALLCCCCCRCWPRRSPAGRPGGREAGFNSLACAGLCK